jgi:serine/threonine-protein kinase
MSESNDVVRRAEQRLGTVLRGKYRLDRILGIGGMATVYEATHRNQAKFALKLLHPEISIRQDVRARFLREGYVANSVKHSGAVRVVDDDVAEDGAAFLVMEMLEGATVEELGDRCGGKMPVGPAVAILDQLLGVLSAAHGKSIVHRDIKPANLFVTREGHLKVLDFGIARARDAAATSGQGGTGTGMLLGTPAFMAPEQALAKSSDIDAQTDVWAAGATLFTLLAGTTVHEGENATQLLVFAATVVARSLASVAPETPPAIVRVVDRALAFHKADRWPSAAAMREGLSVAWRATAGERPSRALLEPFFAEDVPSTELASSASAAESATEAESAQPALGRSNAPAASAATPPERSANPMHATARSPSGAERRRSPATPGVTTARPVAGPTLEEDGARVPMQRGPVVVAALVLAAAVALAGVGWGLFRRGHAEVATAASTASEALSAPVPPPPPSALPAARASALPVAPLPPLASALSSASPAPSELPVVAVKPRGDVGASTKPPPPATPATPSARAAGAAGIPIQW